MTVRSARQNGSSAGPPTGGRTITRDFPIWICECPSLIPSTEKVRQREIVYRDDAPVDLDQMIALSIRSTPGERSPVDRPDIFEGMRRNASLTLTDFTCVTYVAYLAVDGDFRRRGIGRQLIRETTRRLGPDCMIVLFSAPKANEYYPRLGFESNTRGWVLKGEPSD